MTLMSLFLNPAPTQAVRITLLLPGYFGRHRDGSCSGWQHQGRRWGTHRWTVSPDPNQTLPTSAGSMLSAILEKNRQKLWYYKIHIFALFNNISVKQCVHFSRLYKEGVSLKVISSFNPFSIFLFTVASKIKKIKKI